jgi:hypothetical protein
MRHEIKALMVSLVGVVGLLVSACGPTLQVKTDYDRQATFSQYRSFRIDEGQFIEKGVPTQNTIVKDRIQAALHNQLSAQGLTPAGEAADLAVRYAAGARTVKELESVGYGYPMAVGPYWGPYPGDFWVNEYPEGTLVVDLIDTRSNKLVWRAYVKSEGSGMSDQKFINKAVAKAFENFPPRAA